MKQQEYQEPLTGQLDVDEPIEQPPIIMVIRGPLKWEVLSLAKKIFFTGTSAEGFLQVRLLWVLCISLGAHHRLRRLGPGYFSFDSFNHTTSNTNSP